MPDSCRHFIAPQSACAYEALCVENVVENSLLRSSLGGIADPFVFYEEYSPMRFLSRISPKFPAFAGAAVPAYVQQLSQAVYTNTFNVSVGG
jgi:hypothetical protein